jgi:hypothetical protein
MEEDRVPVPHGFWDLPMKLVGRWHDEQEERARLN